MKNAIFLFFTVIAVFLFTCSCKELNKQRDNTGNDLSDPSPAGYDLANGELTTMKKKLDEISGIHYLDENKLLAVQDEKGIVYTVDLPAGNIGEELRFAGAGDYEDITADADFYYVLQSNGTITRIKRGPEGGRSDEFPFAGNGKAEFESLYLTPSGDTLVLLCKKCADEGRRRTINAYAFLIKREKFLEGPLFSIKGGSFAAALDKTGARPSAAAIHPIEKKLYVLCSAGKLLLVCDLNGSVENACPLDPSRFRQPEGIAFNPAGDMFISNEAAGGSANIIKFSYKP